MPSAFPERKGFWSLLRAAFGRLFSRKKKKKSQSSIYPLR
ncbi:hypothetical protein GO283_00968 [Ralstonia solanacearum]|uniref:Uncharacterized protein n=3 Tax=Ralstonia solanacearum species complex TaxID=3116862 RepID=A0A7U7JDK0_RALSL|nr:conserved hypothetical protein [Ralstonia solanacearum Po82]ALF90010.1 hypothetical protein RSUY_37010 [Ralstonia solanacearum]EUJ12948.1 hypothetical protein RSP673_18605 [Ralstonia solanacearum P673]CAD18639.1 hypothetical protein RSp1488 [Ralstonia pseudosolanacearum GMI1000]CEJ16940.1 conserved hypothetical protein [Ralstonia solanacearum IPO1609]